MKRIKLYSRPCPSSTSTTNSRKNRPAARANVNEVVGKIRGLPRHTVNRASSNLSTNTRPPATHISTMIQLVPIKISGTKNPSMFTTLAMKSNMTKIAEDHIASVSFISICII